MEAKVEYDSTSADYKTAILSVCTISPNGARRWSRPKSPEWGHYAQQARPVPRLVHRAFNGDTGRNRTLTHFRATLISSQGCYQLQYGTIFNATDVVSSLASILRLNTITCSTYIPYPASGHNSRACRKPKLHAVNIVVIYPITL